MRQIWIVEMLNCCYSNVAPRWEPTVGCDLTQRGARKQARVWRKKNPYESFRVRCYFAPTEEKP